MVKIDLIQFSIDYVKKFFKWLTTSCASQSRPKLSMQNNTMHTYPIQKQSQLHETNVINWFTWHGHETASCYTFLAATDVACVTEHVKNSLARKKTVDHQKC